MVVLAMALIGMRVARAGEVPPDLAKYEKRDDESVDRALAFLAKNQAGPERAELAGSFNAPGMPGNTGVASLCIMAFLAKGHTPGNGRHGEVINKGIDYIFCVFENRETCDLEMYMTRYGERPYNPASDMADSYKYVITLV